MVPGDLDDINFDDINFDDIDLPEDESFGDEDISAYDVGYQVGYDTGFLEGFEQGQVSLSVEKENDIYNQALLDAIEQVNTFAFDRKNDLISILELLRKA